MQKSDYLFMTAAFLSLLMSVWLWFNGQKDSGLFVGIWVPSLLSAAVLIKSINNHSKK